MDTTQDAPRRRRRGPVKGPSSQRNLYLEDAIYVRIQQLARSRRQSVTYVTEEAMLVYLRLNEEGGEEENHD